MLSDLGDEVSPVPATKNRVRMRAKAKILLCFFSSLSFLTADIYRITLIKEDDESRSNESKTVTQLSLNLAKLSPI